ncbi:MAG: hypothetical protein V1906_00875 [Candidatus Woesearchaeota archaeon]
MLHDEAKESIRKILGNDVELEGHFAKCFDNIKESQQMELLQWLEDCKSHKVYPIIV